MNQRIVELQQKIKEAQKEIEEIRIACPHTETYEGIYSWRIGSYVLSNICTNCGTPVSEVKEHSENWLYQINIHKPDTDDTERKDSSI